MSVNRHDTIIQKKQNCLVVVFIAANDVISSNSRLTFSARSTR